MSVRRLLVRNDSRRRTLTIICAWCVVVTYACDNAAAPAPILAYDYVIRQPGAPDQVVRGTVGDATIRTYTSDEQTTYLLRLALGDSLLLVQWVRDATTISRGTYPIKIGALWPDSNFAFGTSHRRLYGDFRLDPLASMVRLETVTSDSVYGRFLIVLTSSPAHQLSAATGEGRFALPRHLP